MTIRQRLMFAALLALAACNGAQAPSSGTAGVGVVLPTAGKAMAGAVAATNNGTSGVTGAAGKTSSAGSAAVGGTGAAAASTAGAGGHALAGVSGAAGVAGASTAGAGGVMSTGPATGAFPAITDPWMAGPFAVATMPGAGTTRDATVLYPRELGQGGVKHPIVVWDNGAGQTGLSIYGALLNHLASHGFAVYAANSATDEGKELIAGLDWMTAQAADSSSPFYQKLDVTKTAAMGHSQGSIATFAVAADPRLTTTIHLSGGTNPDIAQGHVTLMNLRNPAAFICGEPGGDGLVSGDTASEWCAWDFEHTDKPVFLSQITGASHISAPGMTSGACAAWLRWHLMADTTMRMQFAGDDCVLCKRPNWMTKSKGL